MKSLIIAIIISVIIIGGAIFCSRSVENLIGGLLQINQAMMEDIKKENYESASRRIDEISKTVEDNAVILSSYLDHNEVDKIELQIAQIEAYIDEEEKAMALASGNTLGMLFYRLPRDYRVRLENIF